MAIPRYIASGLCNFSGSEYRFLVMDRFASDVDSLVNKSVSKRLNQTAAIQLVRQMILTLEYIHRRGYAHGDIKGANIMLKNDDEAYLVDYGLAMRFMRDNLVWKF